MGCGNSSAAADKAPPPPQPYKPAKPEEEVAAPPPQKKEKGDSEFPKLIGDLGVVATRVKLGKDEACYAVLQPGKDNKAAELTCSLTSGDVFSSKFEEADLTTKRDQLKTQWPQFFKSIRQSFDKQKVTIKETTPTAMCTLLVPMEPSGKLMLEAKSAGKDPNTTHTGLLEPLATYLTKRRGPDDARFTALEAQRNKLSGAIADHEERGDRLQTEVGLLSTSARQAQDDERAAKEQVDTVSKNMRRLKNPIQLCDLLYPDTPQTYLLHTLHATEHIPAMVSCNHSVLGMIKEKYGADNSNPPPDLVDTNKEEIMEMLGKIDEWDYDVFTLDKLSDGRALFLTTYCLLYKYDLVSHFNMEDESVLTNYLQAIESGYHPNPYHNAAHAADVLQITHYIIEKGGLKKAINMSQEDCLAALLSSAIHDYDHPGLNNNFHIRTRSYLAMLYNDRSVLENHHLTSIFDLMKNPKYDLFQFLSYDQRKDVRDTMIEMVLSTDMGQHAKIFQTFRRRLGEEQEWSKKEDQRLALSIAIKMADISNCCRPSNLYQEWAKRIADEFYDQGDAEGRLGFTISPFMDRRKDKLDFPKGQISFMNYIVIPLFEAGAQMLPDLAFTVKTANTNKEMWLKKQEN